MTSGTTSGKSKMFPKSKKILRRTPGLWYLLMQRKFLSVPWNHLLRRILAVRVYPKFTRTRSGIRQGPVSGITADAPLPFNVTPSRGGDVTSEPDAIYINLLFGLAETELGNLFFPTSALAFTFFKTMETRWRDLCNDLEIGCVPSTIPLSDHWRGVFNAALKGQHSERVRFLRSEFEKGFKGIVSRIWPTCPCVFCISTGAFRVQAKIVKDEYLGDVPMISAFHAGSETLYGCNFDLCAKDVTYVAMTTVNFFEFIPEEEVGNPAPVTVLAHQVDVGKVYEMVVTTLDGLYRYRTEDLVRIVGFYGTVPTYQFVQRSGDILTAITEKVPEVLLASAVYAAEACWELKSINNFTTVENIHVERLLGEYSGKFHSVSGEYSGKFHYVVFLELQEETQLTAEEMLLVDAELMKGHENYCNFRRDGRLFPVQIRQVEAGTFKTVRELILDSNHHMSCIQYKLPRIIRKENLLNLLISRTVQKQESGAQS